MEDQSASTPAGNKPAADGRTVYFSAIRRDNLPPFQTDTHEIRFLGMDVLSHEQAQELVEKLDKPKDEHACRVVLCAHATAEQVAEVEEAEWYGWKYMVLLCHPEGSEISAIQTKAYPPQMPECSLYDLSDTEIAETFSVAQEKIASAEHHSAFQPDAARQKRRDQYVSDLRMKLRIHSEAAVEAALAYAKEHHLPDGAHRCRALRAEARKAEADYLVLASLADRAADGDQDALRELPERLMRQAYPYSSNFKESMEEYVASHMATYDPLVESVQTALARLVTDREPFSADPNATLCADPECMRFDPWPDWWPV